MGNKRYQTTVLTRPQNGLGRPCLTLQNAKSYFAFCTKPVSWEQVWFLSLKRNSWQKLTHKPWTKGKHEVQNHLKLVNRLGSAPAPPCDATKELVVDHGWMEPSIHPKTCCFFFCVPAPSFVPPWHSRYCVLRVRPRRTRHRGSAYPCSSKHPGESRVSSTWPLPLNRWSWNSMLSSAGCDDDGHRRHRTCVYNQDARSYRPRRGHIWDRVGVHRRRWPGESCIYSGDGLRHVFPPCSKRKDENLNLKLCLPLSVAKWAEPQTQFITAAEFRFITRWCLTTCATLKLRESPL